VVEKSPMKPTEKTAALLVIEGEKALIEEKDLAEHASEGVRRREPVLPGAHLSYAHRRC